MEREPEGGLLLNGEIHPYAPGLTIASLVAFLMENSAAVAVELNGEICAREQFDQPLRPGDRLEVLHFVGGG
ncbi:MAG: sulfur carrier protein ThiS [Desulfovibrio sp.]|jgi:thiamine biosynthesis protein ThiS|nr:sulfur carrier protein ThiS [Desulfovibrio sp.]